MTQLRKYYLLVNNSHTTGDGNVAIGNGDE